MEDLNQIQHEELAFRAAQFLRSSEFEGRDLKWYWNPRQTGDENEPDLRATENQEIVLSAEVTTSERPIGTIDSRMRDTLKKMADIRVLKSLYFRLLIWAVNANFFSLSVFVSQNERACVD